MNVIEYYNNNRHFYRDRLRSKLQKQMFDEVEIERILDDLLTKIMRANKEFSSTIHLDKYITKSLANLRTKEYFIKRRQMLKEIPLSANEQISEFALAKAIINKARA